VERHDSGKEVSRHSNGLTDEIGGEAVSETPKRVWLLDCAHCREFFTPTIIIELSIPDWRGQGHCF
jgi:hypothetical protein